MIRRWNVVLTAAQPIRATAIRRTQPLPTVTVTTKKKRVIRPATILAAGLSLSA
jgi:hypothetical protein